MCAEGAAGYAERHSVASPQPNGKQVLRLRSRAALGSGCIRQHEERRGAGGGFGGLGCRVRSAGLLHMHNSGEQIHRLGLHTLS